MLWWDILIFNNSFLEFLLIFLIINFKVSFLEFILENPQTNSVHAFKAFQRGDLKPHTQVGQTNGISDFEFEEVQTPEVEYEDEYESRIAN